MFSIHKLFFGFASLCLGLHLISVAAAENSLTSCEYGVKIERRGVEPAYSMQVRVKSLNYRVTVAMLSPSSQSSRIIAQVLWGSGLRDGNFETYLVNRFKDSFPGAEAVDMGGFLRIVAPQMDRDAFHDSMKKFETQLRNRVTSPAKILTSISPRARSVSPEVSEAARMMIGLLRRNKVSEDLEDLDKILGRTHLHLIRDLSERELRFFDYDLFGEVLSFEKDEYMQSLAKRAEGQVSAKDLDYMAIHEEIRRKFIKLARTEIHALRRHETPYLERMTGYIQNLLKACAAIEANKARTPNLPFDEAGYEEFKKLEGRKLTIYDVREIAKAFFGLKGLGWEGLEKLYIQNYKDLGLPVVTDINSSDYTSFRKDKAWYALYFYNSELNSLLKFLEQDRLDQINNEPANNLTTGNMMSVNLSVVQPGNGGNEGSSFLGMDTGIASSFQHQPHRLNSGRGNQRERFDYDAPRERD